MAHLNWIFKSFKLLVLTATLGYSTVGCYDNTGRTQAEETVPEIINSAPVVSAGSPQAVAPGTSTQLKGIAATTNQTQPLKTKWTKVSGPGTAIFTSTQSLDTAVKFSKPGTYVLRLTAQDGTLSNSDEVMVQVNAAKALEIPAFSVFEQTLTHSGKYANPYTEVEATATFTDPNGKNKTIPLFWDGETTWKMRFSPDIKGTWKWSVSSDDSGLNGKLGSFKTVDAKAKGSIQVNPNYPHHFQYQDGTPFWLKGDTNWRIFSRDDTEKLNRESVKNYIDKRAEQGFNYIHGNLMSVRENEGGLAFNSLDEETLNPAYWQEVDSRVKYMNQKGITAMLILAWSQAGNLGHWKGFPNDEARYRYARYIAARYSAFNTAFNVAGEWNEFGPKSMYQNIAQEIVKADPHDRLIGIHPGERSYSVAADFAEEDWMSFSDYQQNYSDLYERILEVRKFNKPAINSEYAYYLRDADGDGKVDKPNSKTLDEIRHATWDIVMGGGYFVTGWGTTYLGGNRDPGPFNVDDPKNRDWEAQVQQVPKLFKSLEWWKLKPIENQLEGKGTHYLLGEENRQYIVYVRNTNEPLTINLETDNPTTYRVKIYNPRLGEFSDLPKVTGTKSITLEPPSEQDWVFIISQ